MNERRAASESRAASLDREQLTAYDVGDHYDAAYYADLAARYRARNRFARRRIGNVLSLLPPLDGARVLDLGCGMGTFAIECARLGAHALGIDPAPHALDAAQRVAAEERTRDVRFIRGDAAALPVSSESVDVVVGADLTEHLDDGTLAAVLREASRVLRRGGTLVLYTPDRRHIFEQLRERRGMLAPDPSHIGLRSAAELEAAVDAADFYVERVVPLPSHLPVWNLFERGFQRWVPWLRRRVGLRARRP
ncbi:MAG: class I SAM-dependent methyltransferase [Longimicrobiales bacterium]